VSLTAPQIQLCEGTPDRMVMSLRDLPEMSARQMAQVAVSNARLKMPRVTGATASRMQPIYGTDYFGIWFPDSHVWFMERGTRPFTMRSLAGKTIPMWITDVDGEVRRKNPKAQVRTTEDGRTQVKIFRKAAKIGARKTTRSVNRVTGAVTISSVPASYPGAPGRIGGMNRGPDGRITSGNIGVRWRHPGLSGMQFLNSALAETAFTFGYLVKPVYIADPGTWQLAIGRKS
jgi:hypothetical protein